MPQRDVRVGRSRQWLGAIRASACDFSIGEPATCHDARVLTRILFALSAAVLAAAGVTYFAVPGLARGIVDMEATPESQFLLRTEGVALLFGAAIV